MKNIDLTKEPVRKAFMHYLIPAVLATMVTSIYILVDTIMIGNRIGADALAGLNIVFPPIMIFFGTGNLLGIGGSVLMSVALGRNEQNAQKKYFTTAVISGIFIALVYMFILIVFFNPVMRFLGASDVTISYIKDYIKPVIPGIPFFIFSSMIQAFLRNDKAPKTAMAGSLCGGILNIILDYIFMYPLNMGMFGASLASVIGLVVNVAVLCTHFFARNNSLKLSLKNLQLRLFADVIKSGFPVFLTDIASSVLIFLFNIQLLKYYGVIGITIYSIISNTSLTAVSLFNGVSQAAQPITAMNYGAGKYDRIKKVFRLGVTTSIIVGAAFTIAGFIIPERIANIFVKLSESDMFNAKKAIMIYFSAFLFMGANIFMQNYLQSIVKPLLSLIICVIRGIVLSGIILFILPALIGKIGIWFAVPLAEAITVLISIIFYKRSRDIKSG